MNLNLPVIEFKNLNYNWTHNVSNEQRANEFETQNDYYRQLGFNEYNTAYGQTFDVG